MVVVVAGVIVAVSVMVEMLVGVVFLCMALCVGIVKSLSGGCRFHDAGNREP